MTTERIVLAPASPKQEKFLNSSATITLAGGSAGSGKALRHGEKVHTPFGWVNIEDCKIGQQVTTPKGTIETITGVYPQGEVDIYKVTFQDGSSVDTCGEHLWQYHEARGRGKSKVNSTIYLMERMRKGFRPIVPLTEPVEFKNEYSLKIKPYTLGVLIGDGSITTKSVSFITNDEEVTQGVVNEGYELTEWVKEDFRTTARTYGVHKIQNALRELNLLGTQSNSKFIPADYFNASVEDKFKLVQGLMDTDGYVDSTGSTEYCTVSKQLALDVKKLLQSLGFTVTISEKRTSFTYKCEKKQGQVAYNLYIRGKNQSRLFTIARKKDRTRSKLVGNRIIKIEKVTRDQATCISISGEEKLFITTNYIVTHNTYTALLIALKFMQHPRATGVVFRKNSKMLTAPGSIWSEAVEMYSSIYPKGLRVKHQTNEIFFPNGAHLKFSHMQYEHNMYDHKGGQYSLVIFDEASDFSEAQVVYLLSRMRNAHVDYRPQMFLMTNPDYDSFLRLWIQDFYLDQTTGIPKDELAGVKRYFFRQTNEMLWYNNLEDAEAVHGKGDENGISSFTFIPATCRDNPPLLKAQPDYISRLMSLPRVEMERLLLGSWFARPEASGLYKRNWVTLKSFPNPFAKKRVRAWDFAFSLPSEQYPDPDWTAGVLMSKDDANVYTIEDVVRMRDRVHQVERLIFETAEKDGFGVVISIPQDPNAAAGAYAKELQRRLAEKGYTCRLQKPVKSKIVRFAPFSSVAQAGYVHIVDGEWNKNFHDELEVFNGEGKQKDDQCDAVSDCFTLLNKDLILPTFSLPDFGMQNAFSSISSGVSIPYSGIKLDNLSN